MLSKSTLNLSAITGPSDSHTAVRVVSTFILNVSEPLYTSPLAKSFHSTNEYPGRTGIFVSHPPKFIGFRCGTNFSKEIEKLGMNASTRNASLKIIEADDHLANVFSIKEGTKLWMVKRVRYANQSPVMDAIEYFIYNDIPELSLEIINNSIYDFLESKGIIFNHADQKIEAYSASESIANRLYIKQSDALVKVTLISMIKKEQFLVIVLSILEPIRLH